MEGSICWLLFGCKRGADMYDSVFLVPAVFDGESLL